MQDNEMQITSLTSSTRLLTSNGLELKRFQYADGVIDWDIIGGGLGHYRLIGGKWFIYNQDTDVHEPIIENIPEWEQEYQNLFQQAKDYKNSDDR